MSPTLKWLCKKLYCVQCCRSRKQKLCLLLYFTQQFQSVSTLATFCAITWHIHRLLSALWLSSHQLNSTICFSCFIFSSESKSTEQLQFILLSYLFRLSSLFWLHSREHENFPATYAILCKCNNMWPCQVENVAHSVAAYVWVLCLHQG